MKPFVLFATATLLAGCGVADTGRGSPPAAAGRHRTLAEDLTFLRKHGPIEVLTAPGGGQIVLSARYQGRVMTSAVSSDGISLGWVNRDFIAAGQTGTPFDNYGGEDRFWLGPEAGQYGLYFPRGATFDLASWQVPQVLQEGSWAIGGQSKTSVTYGHPIQITNYGGTRFEMQVARTVRVLTAGDVTKHFGRSLPDGVRWTGFETINRVTNSGRKAWTKADGLPSIWILGMFNALGSTTVVIPFDPGAGGEVVNDRYFGKVPEDRLSVRDGYVLFSADGRYRSKIGIGPAHAKPVLGSYSPDVQLLTLVQFDRPAGATDYVNSMWEQQKDPYAGDVVNSYNDGPPNTGGWYELESSSPALALQPDSSVTHTHRTLHIVGPAALLDSLAARVLGVPAGTLLTDMRQPVSRKVPRIARASPSTPHGSPSPRGVRRRARR
jgi:hypothetical protein